MCDSTSGSVSHNTWHYAEALTTKEVAYLLDNRDDPEVDAAIKTYLKAQYGGAKPTVSSSAGELASKVEKKYIAAQVVAQGVQVRVSTGSFFAHPFLCKL